MSTSRTNTSPDPVIQPNTILPHISYSALATLIAHPTRVFLNRASLHQSIVATLKDGSPYLLKGLAINLLRGTLSTGAQSYSKEMAQKKGGLTAGIAAAAVCGTFVATFVETPFIRKTMAAGQLNASLWRFCFPLASLYLFREAGFCITVLAKNDLSPVAQNATLFGATFATAIAHKFVAIEATRDMLPQGVIVPDFRQGIATTIRSLARGDVYTHPAFQVPFKNPKNMIKMAGNLLQVSCGANMFVFRLMYLLTFREAYQLAVKATPSLKKWTGLFDKPENKPSAMSDAGEVKKRY